MSTLKNVEKKEQNTAELTIEISAAELNAAMDRVYRQARGAIVVPGFRKGKAPRQIIERMYGKDVFMEDAMNDIYPDAVDAAVTEAELDVVGYPQVNVQNIDVKTGVTMVVTVGLKPTVKLGDYKGISAEKASAEVTDEDIENEMKPLVSRASTTETVERAAENGDTAVIDFEGFKDGVAFAGGKGENYDLVLGSGSFIPGFEEQVVGMSAGEEKEINVTFPENYGAEDLAGAAVVFKVKVNEVKAENKPVIDDEFAKDVSEFETLDELKADLAKTVAERKEKSAQSAFETAVMDKVIANAEIVVPDTMVEYEMDKQIQNMEAQLNGSGISFDQYLQMMGTNMKDFRDGGKPTVLRSIKLDAVVEAVADVENIAATEEEVENEIADLSKQYGMGVEEIKKAIPVENIANSVRMKKANKLIIDSAVVAE